MRLFSRLKNAPKRAFKHANHHHSYYILTIGRFNKLVFNVRQCFCFTWMSSRLSHRRFLSFIQSRNPLRSLVKNKNLRHDSRKYIAS